MHMIDIAGLLFLAVWLFAALSYMRSRKKHGKCIGCSGCASNKECSNCKMKEF